uniref:Uncharacterized protein n=1 Tax=Tanacetum cinerariifolium TaxID=118510 RepID=A0A6L2LXT9_TANCI|nr:hypothetical protein [Tanacetum cinerariifolium]
MDDPNITMEEYIRREEEKARRRGKVYNWETATYGKIWDNEDIHDLGSIETEYPAIVFNDTLTYEVALSCELTVSSLNNDEIDFRISFDESDDQDYTVKERSRKGQNRNKTGQKGEAYRRGEMVKAVTVDRARKTEENKKRMNENANTGKKLFKFKETSKEQGPHLQILQSFSRGAFTSNRPKLVPQGRPV